MNIKPINDRLILHPSDSVMRGAIFVPERYTDAATSCLVLAKGPDVSRFIRINDLVLCQVGFGDRKNNTIENTRSFWCRQHNVYAIVRNNIIYSLGRTVLVRREISDAVVGGIVIPENRRYQSLDCRIERLGLTTEHFKTVGLQLGARARLKEWSENMIEVTLEDGGYGLIVRESDILFLYE